MLTKKLPLNAPMANSHEEANKTDLSHIKLETPLNFGLAYN